MLDKKQFDPALKDQQRGKKMAISEYAKGSGARVKSKMRDTYKAEDVFTSGRQKFQSKSKMRGAMENAMKRGRKRTEKARKQM